MGGEQKSQLCEAHTYRNTEDHTDTESYTKHRNTHTKADRQKHRGTHIHRSTHTAHTHTHIAHTHTQKHTHIHNGAQCTHRQGNTHRMPSCAARTHTCTGKEAHTTDVSGEIHTSTHVACFWRPTRAYKCQQTE